MIGKIIPLILGLYLVIGSLNSCSDDPVKPCDTCETPCDTCAPCDTCDTTKPTPNDTTSHDFVWTQYNIPTESNLTGVYVHSDTEIFVIGSYLYRFDGKSWNRIDVRQTGTGRQLAFPDFTMFGLGPSDIWIVHGGIIDHYIGNSLAEEYRDAGGTACWGTSNKDMFFVSTKGNIVHFDGTTFTKMTSPTTKDLRSVWGTSHNDVWATGYNSSTDESVLLHYDGTSWTEDEFSTSGQVRNFGIGTVWAVDSASHPVRVIAGTRVFRKTDNGPWRKDSIEIGNSLGGGEFIGIGAYGNSPSDFMAIGGWGFVSHWNGKSWYKYNELYDFSNLNYGPAGFSMKVNTACIVGTKSGKSWIAIGRRK